MSKKSREYKATVRDIDTGEPSLRKLKTLRGYRMSRRGADQFGKIRRRYLMRIHSLSPHKKVMFMDIKSWEFKLVYPHDKHMEIIEHRYGEEEA